MVQGWAPVRATFRPWPHFVFIHAQRQTRVPLADRVEMKSRMDSMLHKSKETITMSSPASEPPPRQVRHEEELRVDQLAVLAPEMAGLQERDIVAEDYDRLRGLNVKDTRPDHELAYLQKVFGTYRSASGTKHPCSLCDEYAGAVGLKVVPCCGKMVCHQCLVSSTAMVGPVSCAHCRQDLLYSGALESNADGRGWAKDQACETATEAAKKRKGYRVS